MINISSIIKLFHLFIVSVLLFYLPAGCSSGNSVSPDYKATIAEAKTTAREAIAESGATALTLALVDGERVIWTESLGEADKGAGKAVGPETMFGIGSISKIFAAISVMKLVDQRRVSLKAPLITYLPRFSMVSPEYRDITVDMLLNHSSGLPGGTMRGALTSAPFTGFAGLVMEDLSYQRLVFAPGYLNVYNNDGFTMVENLVKEVTGISYPEYVRREILGPLGMTDSIYAEDYLVDGSYARTYTGETPHPYTSLNYYGAGGLYSTAADMAKMMMMLINGGVYGATPILSFMSVTAMSQDQTVGTFNPEPSDFIRYGLGWDTVTQAGLSAVGIRGWQKGGAVDGFYGTMYRSTMIIAPDERLGVFVVMASNNISSDLLDRVGERILLRALVERGTLAEMPPALPQNPLPALVPTPEERNAFSGFYAASGALYRLNFEGDAVHLDTYENNRWKPTYQGFKKRSDGWYAADGDSITALRFLTSSKRSYIALRKASGAGHYASTRLMAQRLDDRNPVSAAWQGRLGVRWLPVNDDSPASFPDVDSDPSIVLTTVDDVTGYVLACMSVFRDMDPPTDDRLDGMFLQIPQLKGRDLADVAVEQGEDGDRLRFGSTLYRPLSGVPSVPLGSTSVIIGNEGFSEWRKLPVSGSVSIKNATVWRLFNSDFQLKGYGTGDGSVLLPGSGEAAYLALFGAPGTTILLEITAI